MPESLTYYHHNGVDYAVMPLGIEELEALVGYIPDHAGMREDYVEALAHLTARRVEHQERAHAIFNEADSDGL